MEFLEISVKLPPIQQLSLRRRHRHRWVYDTACVQVLYNTLVFTFVFQTGNKHHSSQRETKRQVAEQAHSFLSVRVLGDCDRATKQSGSKVVHVGRFVGVLGPIRKVVSASEVGIVAIGELDDIVVE
jgi:hypothetical protein